MSIVLLPKRIVNEIEKRGVSVEDAVLDALAKTINIDSKTVADARIEIAEIWLEEGRSLIDKDPVQASEKLYKAAEECVKALTVHFNLAEILANVEKRGRWTVAELEKAVLKISDSIGEWFGEAWDRAWALHVWGFHEGKFDSEDVRRRIPHIEKMIRETVRVIRKQSSITNKQETLK